MNELTARGTVLQEDSAEVLVGCELLVDGGPITEHEGATISVSQLDASARGTGEYWILTCSCGEPGCAGVLHPIRVSHAGPTIVWEEPAMDVRTRHRFVVAADGSTQSEDVPPMEPRTARRFEFDAEQYRSTVAAFVGALPEWVASLTRTTGKAPQVVPLGDEAFFGLRGGRPTRGST